MSTAALLESSLSFPASPATRVMADEVGSRRVPAEMMATAALPVKASMAGAWLVPVMVVTRIAAESALMVAACGALAAGALLLR